LSRPGDFSARRWNRNGGQQPLRRLCVLRPYDARFINEDTLTANKCTFCAHRLEQGLLPACVETCVGGARVIGDLNHPSSEIRRLIAEHQHEIKVLKPNEGTKPHVFYIGMDECFTSHINGQAAIRGRSTV
jgi:tetrathionate reductase subunit B